MRLLLLVLALSCTLTASEPKVVTIQEKDLTECSGIASSRRQPGKVFWMHNDSGDRARIFAINRNGKGLGSWHMKGVTAVDWEDMASATIAKEPCLLIADSGDNRRQRNSYRLHIVQEPKLTSEKTITTIRTIHYQYPGGPQDCEGIASDGEVLYLLTKSNNLVNALYVLPLKEVGKKSTAKQIAWVPVATPTGIDCNERGMVVLNYGRAFEFRRRKGDSWAEAFRRKPIAIPYPPLPQAEAICYDPNRSTLHIVSEGAPAKWLQIERGNDSTPLDANGDPPAESGDEKG